MHLLLALGTGVLFAAGTYLMLRRSIVKLAFGLALIAHAAILAIFTTGGLVRGEPPIIEAGSTRLAGASSDPVPQALILTAIVIGFALQAFVIVLIKRTARIVGTDDLDDLRNVDRTTP
jgi:multicomponent Na+:H+ antiporter subunit C